MILLQLRIIFRNFKNTRLFSTITIFGLTVGMTATILLFTYVQHELSYDHFHEKSQRIYRINSIITGETEQILPVCIGLNDSTLQKQVPEIEELLQVYEIRFGETELTKGNVRFKNINLIYSDPTIHKVFTLKYLRGNPDEALVNPNSIVITRRLSEKMFGSIDIIGKTFLTNYSKDLFTVTGVIEDYPSTSHLKIDAIAPIKSTPFIIYNSGCELNTYVLFRNKINLEEGINKTMACYNKLLAQRMTDRGYKKTGCFLQKLTDIHLKSGFQAKGGFDTEYKKVFIYLSLALIVLLIAIINFINLLTAQYEGKSKEIGIQKAMGASRIQIIATFLVKSFIFSFVAMIFAAFLVDLLIPEVGHVLNRDLISTYNNNLILFIGLPLLAVIVGLISGAYPALFISRFSPDKIIKRDLPATKGKTRFTWALVVMQFSIMIFLIVSLIVMKRQIVFMKNADLGFNADGVIAITDLNDNIGKSYPVIKNALKSIPEIKSVGASLHLFGTVASGQNIEVIGKGPMKEYPIKEYRVFPGFFETLGFRFIAGRPFDDNILSDKTAIVLNETAVKTFGLAEPLNSDISLYDKMHVIGVVKDFHFSSLEESIEPMMFTYYNNRIKNIMLKISGNDTYNVLQKVE